MMSLLLSGLGSRAGLLALAFLGVFVFYEGVPIGPLGAIPLVGPVLEGFTDGRVDRERKRALEGFVARAELEAANAKLAELERQRNAGAQALEEYRKRLAAWQAVAAAEDERHEKEITDYEKKLADLGKSCLVDADFLDFLLEPGKTAGPGRAGQGQGGSPGQPAGAARRLPRN